ncbi:MAG: amidohydrolase family protein [Acidobacteriota bacterium]|nr:amidohydrolase family protein [Acidobacteriota bacterium]
MNPTCFAVACLISLSIGHAQAQAPRYDTIIRHGTVLDGSGNPRYDADIAVRNGFIVAIGDLAGATAATEIEARGLFVTPGFINIHSHASPDALPTAVNMLTQGVTTEIFNADGNGPLDIAQQMQTLAASGLAVNIGGYIGFNAAWQSVNGNADKRPTPAEIEQMRALIARGLDQGAWGVSAGLDYKPGYFARTEEVIRIVDVARPFRTNFTNHDRIAPESNYSSKVGVAETVAIGQKAGLVPVVTHMKAQGLEQGTAGAILASMDDATRRGAYTAADAYPYLAGQSGLGSLIIPGWAQEGGRQAMLKRFAEPAERARIITEAEQAMTARFGGPQGVYLPRTQQELTAVMKDMNAGAGETIVRILETTGDPGAILRFGSEADLVKILQHPTTSMACDCGASTATRVHPRFYGSYPRVLGRYVREQQIMSWEEAIRKSSALPAATIGMIDRGLIALGMAADLVVLDPATVIDRATYEQPALPSEGIRHVLVNGTVALTNGTATGVRSGRALLRSGNMPSRPMSFGARELSAKGLAARARVAIDITHRAGARQAIGTFTIDAPDKTRSIAASVLGVLQSTDGWSSFTGVTTTAGGANERAFTAIVDQRDPAAAGSATIVVTVEGETLWRGTMPIQ